MHSAFLFNTLTLVPLRRWVRELTARLRHASGLRSAVYQVQRAVRSGDARALRRSLFTFLQLREACRNLHGSALLVAGPGSVSVGMAAPHDGRVGDRWHPGAGADLIPNLGKPDSGCLLLDPERGWVPLTNDNAHVVGQWRRVAEQHLRPLIEQHEAQVRLWWGLVQLAVATFERRLSVNTYSLDGQPFASAVHALQHRLNRLPALWEGIPAEKQYSFGTLVMTAQAECARLELEDEREASRRGELEASKARIDSRLDDVKGQADACAVQLQGAAAELTVIREEMPMAARAEAEAAIGEHVRREHGGRKQPVPREADPMLVVGLVLSHCPTNQKTIAKVLHMSRNTVRRAMQALKVEPAPDYGYEAVKPSQRKMDELKRDWDMDCTLGWAQEVIDLINNRKDGRRCRAPRRQGNRRRGGKVFDKMVYKVVRR